MRKDKPMNTIYKLRAILLMLLRSRPIYASEVPSLVKEKSGDNYSISIACILTELSLLLEEGLIEVDSTVVAKGPKKYYKLTKMGSSVCNHCLGSRTSPESMNSLAIGIKSHSQVLRSFFTAKGLTFYLLGETEPSCGADIVASINSIQNLYGSIPTPLYERRSVYKAIKSLEEDGYIATIPKELKGKTRKYYQLTREGLLLQEDCRTFEASLMES